MIYDNLWLIFNHFKKETFLHLFWNPAIGSDDSLPIIYYSFSQIDTKATVESY